MDGIQQVGGGNQNLQSVMPGGTQTGGGGLPWYMSSPDQGNRAYQQGLDRTQQQRQFDSTLGFQGKQLAQQGALTREGFANTLQNTRLPLQYQQGRFNEVFPYYQNLLHSLMHGGSANSAVGGQSGAGPHISAAPIYDPGQLQSQINNQNAQNAMATGTQVHNLNAQLGGQGYGSNSPLAALLSGNLYAQNQANSAGQAQDLRFQAAQGNATQTLNAQQAQEGQYSNRMQEDIARRRTYASTLQGMLQGLGGLV